MLPVLLLLLLESGSNERRGWLGSEVVVVLGAKEKSDEGEVRALEAAAFEAAFTGKEQCLEAGKDGTTSSPHAQLSRLLRIEIYGLLIHRLPSVMNLAEVGKCKFINQAECHSRMLQHVIKVKVLDLVFRGVDFMIAVLEVRLDDER